MPLYPKSQRCIVQWLRGASQPAETTSPEDLEYKLAGPVSDLLNLSMVRRSHSFFVFPQVTLMHTKHATA